MKILIRHKVSAISRLDVVASTPGRAVHSFTYTVNRGGQTGSDGRLKRDVGVTATARGLVVQLRIYEQQIYTEHQTIRPARHRS